MQVNVPWVGCCSAWDIRHKIYLFDQRELQKLLYEGSMLLIVALL